MANPRGVACPRAGTTATAARGAGVSIPRGARGSSPWDRDSPADISRTARGHLHVSPPGTRGPDPPAWCCMSLRTRPPGGVLHVSGAVLHVPEDPIPRRGAACPRRCAADPRGVTRPHDRPPAGHEATRPGPCGHAALPGRAPRPARPLGGRRCAPRSGSRSSTPEASPAGICRARTSVRCMRTARCSGAHRGHRWPGRPSPPPAPAPQGTAGSVFAAHQHPAGRRVWWPAPGAGGPLLSRAGPHVPGPR